MITIDGDANAFASGRGNTAQCSDLTFVFNPVGLRAVPYSALGGGFLLVLPEELGTYTFSVLDEIFYNVEALPWLHVTPDFQVVEPALKSIDTAVILGLRMMIDF